MSFDRELKKHIKAGIPAMYVETTEWDRFYAELQRACGGIKLRRWNSLEGWENNKDCVDFGLFVRELHEELESGNQGRSITVIEYADDIVFESRELPVLLAVLLRKLRERNHQIIVVAPTLNLPHAVKSDFSILSLPLPGREDIKIMLESTPGLEEGNFDSADEILDSVRGLGTEEIRNAFSKVAAEFNRITAEEISHLVAEKEQIIRKSGYLEYINTDVDLGKDIGGLKNLKKWLESRRIAFGTEARQRKLQAPKGVLLLGIPGTGKSLSAKAVARTWKMPLLRLDMARIFGGLVGESESNMRKTIKIAESMEPCVLWVDEIEKGLSGGQGGERDGGTSARVFGTFLTWMQEKQEEVFIFATANDISKLPPELLRKGRFDEIFFVDLPSKEARKTIFKIHLKAKDQEKVEPTDELLEATEGYSGAEIEAIVNEAHFSAHNENSEEPKIHAKNIIDAARNVTPLSRTMRETIMDLRRWAKDRCREADEDAPPEITIDGTDRPRLPQESHNIFMKSDE